ncbi:hypothetical protein QYF61_021849 [Mycteria americana]|uniref:C-type lectin domain-containing protein n=1 Tax=Mycteria americana TaxID=33587 RepID=A0AAN7N0I1_MYCAM|nr:hypothetical protein QYF61_021849 [Mycteria americana]
MGWTLHGTKCYWVVSDVNSWNQSKQDCVNRSAELLMPGDQEELVKGPMASGMWDGSQVCSRGAGGTWGRRFIKGLVQKHSRYFWIGLSIPSAGKGWTWLNGSRLDQSR